MATPSLQCLRLLLAVLLVLFCGAAPGLAATPEDPTDGELMMFASAYSTGAIVAVNIDPYGPEVHPARLDPANALGAYDAVQALPTSDVNTNEFFFGLAAREWTNYTFESEFWNIDGAPDIQFSEVTWGIGWHAEAALVYLTGAYIRDEEGELVAYGAADDGIGYYAGTVWNRLAIGGIAADRRVEVTQEYFAGDRAFVANTFLQEGEFGISQFYLPEEVVYASGITLVDISADVYDEFQPATYLNLGNPNNGYLVTLLSLDPLAVNAVYGTDGNTDGFDLDAIRVYKYVPGGDDAVTGLGTRILPKGSWFMYNQFDAGMCPLGTYDLQAGNPLDGLNLIGTFTVTCNSDGSYTIDYDLDETVSRDGYVYEIVVLDEHLAVSDTMSFTAVAGQDDNQDFGVPFQDEDGSFYIFVHLDVQYR